MSKYLALSSSIPDFFAFLKRLPFFLISLFKFMFIHGRLCGEFENFYGMLIAKIPSLDGNSSNAGMCYLLLLLLIV